MPDNPANPLMSALGRVAGNKAAIGSAIALASKFGLKGLVLLSRGYLGPLAAKAERREEEAARREEEAVRREEESSGVDTIHRVSEQPRTTTTKTSVGGLSPGELAVIGLAVTKLVYEAGEIALHNPTLDSTGKQPMFVLDENGRAPAMSLAHIAAAMRLVRAYSAEKTEHAEAQKLAQMKAQPEVVVTSAPRTRMYAARSAYYGTSTRYSYAEPQRATAKITSTGKTGANMSSRGCGTCGGSHPVSTPPSTPSSAPCGTGLGAPSRSSEGCGCGGSCGCKSGAKSTGEYQSSRTYDSEKCPTFAISCETKTALRDCAKDALCNFLRCLADTLCPDGRFDSDVFNDPTIGKQLVDCVGQLACTFIHCVPEALCPPVREALPAPIDCVPCDYAVEVSR